MTAGPHNPPETDAGIPTQPRSTANSVEWEETLHALITLFETSDAIEVTLTTGDLHLRLKRGDGRGEAPGDAGPIAAPRPASTPPSPHPAASETAFHAIRAPLTGIWYDSPSAGSTSYVQVGSHIEVGSVIGLIETMKIFNEIASDAAGRVTQVHVRRADLVQVNAPLVSLDTTDIVNLWPQRS